MFGITGVFHMLDNEYWQAELRRKDSRDLGKCQFPRHSEMEICGSRDQVTITLTNKGLYGNMQTDAAAFEAWALALLCHCDVKSVAIALKQGLEKPADGPQEQHFERFLYRLMRFAELFPEHITVDRQLAGTARALGDRPDLFLNQPLNHRDKLAIERGARLDALFGPSGRHSEADLEKALEVSDAFREALALDKVMRQWPVGLFVGCVAAGNRIFTGGKSAIDLIGIRKKELVLVELKKQGNCKVGAISELLFYSSLMRDALKGRFGFEDRLPKQNCAVSRTDIMNCTSISAVLLAPDMHPLIQHPAIVTRLNSALACHWPDRPVHFDVIRVGMPKNRDEDFIFS